MAGNIKGITIEFSADMTKLNAGLKKANSALSNTQAELKSVNRALKFNPSNTTLLKQKFDLLKQSVSQTEDKLKVLKQQQAKMNANNVDKASAEYRKLEREIIKTENQLKNAQGQLRRFGSVGKQQALAVGKAFKTAGGKIKSAGKTITTSVSLYGMAGIYAGGKLIEMANAQSEAENKLAEIYKSRMGVGKKAVQSTLDLASAEQKVGVVGDEVQLSAAQQLATYAKYPSTVNTMLPAINDLLVQQKGMNATQEDAAGLANLFGKAMMGQTGALKRAGISFSEAQEEILKTGTEEEKAATIAEVVTQNVGDMNEAFAETDAGKIQQAKNALGDMGEEIGAILLPAVADLVSWLQDNLMPKIQQVIDYFKEHPQIAKFALAFAGITTVLGPLIVIFGALASAIGGIITIAPVVAGAFGAITAPVMGVVVAIGAAIAIAVLLYKNWDKIKKKLLKIWNEIKKAVTLVVNHMKKQFQTAVNFIKSVWSTVVSFFRNIWNGIKSAFASVATFFRTIFTTAVKAIKTAFNGIKTFFVNIWNGIKTAFSNCVTFYKNIFTKAVKAIKTAFNGIKTFFVGVWGKIKEAFPNVAKWFGEKFSGVMGAIKEKFKGWGEYWSGLWDKVKEKFTGLGTKIGDAISGAVKSGINKVISGAETVINKAIGIINSAIGLINKLPGVNVGKVGRVSFPRLAQGGVLKKGQFGVLEGSGAEAVVPLEKNREWIGKVASVFMREMASVPASQSVNNNSNITVNVYAPDGMSVTELASAVERRLIQSQKRRTAAWA